MENPTESFKEVRTKIFAILRESDNKSLKDFLQKIPTIRQFVEQKVGKDGVFEFTQGGKCIDHGLNQFVKQKLISDNTPKITKEKISNQEFNKLIELFLDGFLHREEITPKELRLFYNFYAQFVTWFVPETDHFQIDPQKLMQIINHPNITFVPKTEMFVFVSAVDWLYS